MKTLWFTRSGVPISLGASGLITAPAKSCLLNPGLSYGYTSSQIESTQLPISTSTLISGGALLRLFLSTHKITEYERALLNKTKKKNNI